MPNWNEIARKRFSAFGIYPPELNEELAAHLEDSYDALCAAGLPEEVAFQRTMSQIEGRRGFRLVIGFLQEEFMTGCVPKVVLPGLITAAAAYLLYRAVALDHTSPTVVWIVGGQLPAWWWCLLPLYGAAGAFLSQRNKGSRLQRMAASTVPVAILCTLTLIIFVAGFTMSGLVNDYQLISTRLESLALVPPGFGAIPATLSLLGAAIAEVSTKRSRRVAY